MAIQHNEPVLLVGETGCGKTTICQALAAMRLTELKSINCHQYTETSDFIGSLQPVRDRANLRHEINEMVNKLALSLPDSELKTNLLDINMSLEQKYTYFKKIPDISEELKLSYLRSLKLFEWSDGPLIDSYNFGKFLLIDEISLADDSVLERLNSVLEIDRKLLVPEKGGECSLEMEAKDGFQLFATMNPGGDYGKKELSPALRNRFTEIWVRIGVEEVKEIIMTIIDEEKSNPLIKFFEWYNLFARNPLSLRDAIAWANFIQNSLLDFNHAFWEGASMILLDSLDANNKQKCNRFITEELEIPKPEINYTVSISENLFGIYPFFIDCPEFNDISNYSFEGPSIKQNLYRLLRSVQLNKPIMLEGPPGVGKTSIVESLGKITGHKVTRINLSEETDLIDLLGCDIPVGDRFEWCDGVLLTAIKNGSWVILDELNLCPQPVIEGLNALLDHRATIYIPEINKEIVCPQSFRIFAAQNPVAHGGGRKGLPKSFLNRFMKIYINELTKEDYKIILQDIYKDLKDIPKLVEFNDRIKKHIQGPWEFNLRDMLRWCQGGTIELLYFYRIKTAEQRLKIQEIYQEIFNVQLKIECVPYYRISPEIIEIGQFKMQNPRLPTDLALIPGQLNILEQILTSIQKRWPVLLVGEKSVGKASVCRLASFLMKKTLHEYTLSPTTDSSELLGSFEQNENGNFEWFESTLAKALRIGDWVLLRNANLCPAAVLDRINSLMEPNGSLLINERGQVNGESYILKAHPDFCMFITFNPKQGEVSRALRNRCIELSMLENYDYTDVSRITGTHFVTKQGFENLSKHGFGEILKWEDLSKITGNKEKSYKLIFGHEMDNYMDTEKTLLYEKLSSFLLYPVESYLSEDSEFLSKWNYTDESKSCFIANGSEFDTIIRSDKLKLDLNQFYHKIIADFKTQNLRFDVYTPLLDQRNQIQMDIDTDVKIALQIVVNLIVLNVQNINCYDLVRLSALFLWHLAKDEFTKYKINSKLNIADEFRLAIAAPSLSKSLISSWKLRVKSTIKSCPIKFEKLPSILTSQFCKKLMANINFIEEFPKRKTVIVSGEDFIEEEIGLIMDKESYQAEEIFYMGEIKDLYEQVLFRVLIGVLDGNRFDDEVINEFLSNDYIPASLLKPLWILKYKIGLPYSLRDITLPILQTPPTPKSDFLKIFKEAKETTILQGPKHWFLIKTLIKWPKVESPLAIPRSYMDLVQNELEVRIDGIELNQFLSGSESYRTIGLGLWLYKLYKGLICDPSLLYSNLSKDYSEISENLKLRIQVREEYNKLRYGYNAEIPLIKYYLDSIESLAKRIQKADNNTILRTESSDVIINYVSQLPPYDRLLQLVTHNLSSTETEGTKYLYQLLNSYLSTLTDYQTVFPDLCSPLLESLLLILYGLNTLSFSAPHKYIFPYNSENLPKSFSTELIKGHLFDDSDFLGNFSTHIFDLTDMKPIEENLKMKVVRTTELVTVHTVGEKSKDENQKEYEEIEKREIEKLFPNYRDAKAWVPVEMKKRREIIDA